jgi:predicted RNA-binding protein associated with RNAse of E/G family
VSTGERVRIHYQRLPDDEQVFDQRVVLARPDVIVTVTDPLDLAEPMRTGGRIMLEPGSRAVWFTFPGEWHDLGRFHRADGTFTGYYANILTPPRIEGGVWHTTDLFLDVWIPEGGGATLLDEDEMADALGLGHIDPDTAARAREEADRLLADAARGTWPPPVALEWTLERIVAEQEEKRA